MKIIGLTGGIGSGKTTVANLFENWGIPVFTSDIVAKKLMCTNTYLKKQLISNFGTKTYKDNVLNTSFLSNIIFNNPKELNLINCIVHPFVEQEFEKWKTKQTSNLVIKEAAILFETAGNKKCDTVVTVVSDTEKRIKRVMLRNTISRNEIIKRIQNQWSDQNKIQLSNFVITNNSTIQDLKTATKEIFKEFCKFNL